MERKKLDSLIRNTLYQKTRNINAPCSLHDKILKEIKEQKEDSFMKRFGWKKAVVLAAVLCILGTIVAVGAGKVTSLVDSSEEDSLLFPTFEEAKKAGDALGYAVQIVENFASGYQYERGNISTIDGYDDGNNKVASYRQLRVSYLGTDGDKLKLLISKPVETENGPIVPPKEEQEISGVQVSYYCDHYKIFPPDAEIPQEDLDAQERGELYLSVGSSEIEEMYSSHVNWVRDGVRYSLMNTQKQMSADEMFAMAKEVMEAEAY